MRTGRDECENLCLPFVYNLAGECFSDIPGS